MDDTGSPVDENYLDEKEEVQSGKHEYRFISRKKIVVDDSGKRQRWRKKCWTQLMLN